MPMSSPAFGEADLSNCEREPIHLAGSIQPQGVLLKLDEPSLTIVQASANAADVHLPDNLVGRPLAALDGDIDDKIRPYLARNLEALPVALRCHVGRDRLAVDGLLHRPSSGGLIIELERAGPLVDLSTAVEAALQKLIAAPSLRRLADDTAAGLKTVAAGLIATPLFRSAGDYLIWFRPERVQTVTWGGNPFKPVVVGNDPSDLSPRRSFSQWHQQVEGTSDPWSEADQAAARLIGDAIADFALQFRSVRMLIARTQLEQVSQEVRRAEQPLMITDRDGQALLTNAALDQLLGEAAPLTSIDQVPARFEPGHGLDAGLEGLRQGRTSWKGEVAFRDAAGRQRAFLLRIDAVHATPDSQGLMGYVLLFGDLTEQKSAEEARRHFQEDVITRHRVPPAPLGTRDDLLYRNILTSVIGNAQLAALEVADSMDVTAMSDMLESITSSVNRTASLLEHLIIHAARGDDA